MLLTAAQVWIETLRTIEGLPRVLSPALGLLTLLCVVPAGADDSRFDAGLLAGFNRARLSGDPIPETTVASRAGFLIGGRIGMRVREDIGLILEPSYVGRGGKVVTIVDDSDDIEETTRIDLYYLEFPLLVRVRGSARARPYALGGLGVGFLLDATSSPPVGGSVDLSDEVRPTDLFACFGGGVEATIAGQEVTFEARYTQGLRNVSQSSSGGTPIPGYFKNTALQIVVGWRAWP